MGSEMCIRDSGMSVQRLPRRIPHGNPHLRAVPAEHILIVTVSLVLPTNGNNRKENQQQTKRRASHHANSYEAEPTAHQTHPHPMPERLVLWAEERQAEHSLRLKFYVSEYGLLAQ